jgi:hypothetical protein
MKIDLAEYTSHHLQNLYKGKYYIYHERISFFCELLECEISEKNFKFKAKALYGLGIINDRPHSQKYLKNMLEKDFVETGFNAEFARINDKRISPAMTAWMYFFDATFVEKIEKLQQEGKLAEVSRLILW